MAVDASVFFEQLEVFSHAWICRYVGTDVDLESPWQSGQWTHGEPKGAVIHYTADPDPVRVARWFLDPRHNARVSSHALILPSWTEELRILAEPFPDVAALSAPVVQIVGLDKEAWHATWANSWAYGIENVNPGHFRSRGADLVWCGPRDAEVKGWDQRWNWAVGPQPVWVLGKWWCPYPWEQIQANVELLWWVSEFWDNALGSRSRIVGHEHVQGNKSDPGPAFPLHAVRDRLFDSYSAPWDFGSLDPLYGQFWRDQKLCDWYEVKDPEVAWRKFAHEIRNHAGYLLKWDDWGSMALAFELLGYSMRNCGDESIQIFQRSAGAKPDGVVGPETWRALQFRLYHHGMLVDG